MVMYDEPLVAQSKGEVKKLWFKTVESEERTGLLNALVKEGIGAKDVEAFFGKSCDFLRVGAKGVSQGDKIYTEMRDRVKDNEIDEGVCRKMREVARNNLEDLIGANSR